MSAAAPVRCPVCHGVAFAIVHGIAEGVCCGRRITAERSKLDRDVRIVSIDRPEKRLVESARN